MSDDYDPNPDYLPPKADEPPLHRAARLGDHDAIRALVAAGAELEAEYDLKLDPGGRAMLATPLMVACGSGDGATVETVRLLVSLGASARASAGGQSAARFAAGGLGWNYRPGGDAARLRLMLEAGCDVNETDARGATLLADAASAGDLERARVLLACGASSDPAPALRHEAEGAPFMVDYSFQIPLFGAAESGNAELVSLLIESKATLGVIDNQNRTAIFHAANEAVIRKLMAAGFDLEARDTYGWSPLGAAVVDGAVDRARAFLAAGADVNARHDRGFTIFMSAAGAMERKPEMLRLLISAGADPHAVTHLGWNAFHAAVDVSGEATHEESVRATLSYLKSLGVDITLRNKAGETPLMRARNWGTEVEAHVLQELGALE